MKIRFTATKTAALAFALTLGMFGANSAFADDGTANSASPKPAATETGKTPATTNPEPKPQPTLGTPTTGKIGTAYLMSGCEMTLEKVEYTTQSLPNLFGPVRPDDGMRYLLFTIHIQNNGTVPVMWTYDSFRPTLQSNASAKILRGAGLLTSSNKRFELQPLKPGEEKTLHFHFQVPDEAIVTALTIGETAISPKYTFDLTGIH